MTTTTATARSTASPRRVVVQPHSGVALLALCTLGAGLTIASGAIHLDLWNSFYRHIHTGHMNDLFLVQWILCFVGGAALLAMRNLLAVVANAALLAGTFIGFLIAKYHQGGLFGFAIPGFSSWQTRWTTGTEIAGTVILLVTAVMMVRAQRARR
ncbi:MAG TPA: hypothetical protein VHV76_13140 [Mycobacteriales bacterium]|jgi:energy-converting hydrogenase Eha subunit C|nr:hypothetical protein [Mycobacteriales bacterium]